MGPGAGDARPDGTLNRIRRIVRRDLLVLVTTIMFVAVGAAMAILVDRTGFLPEKGQVLEDAWKRGEIFPIQEGDRLSITAYNFLIAISQNRNATNEREALTGAMQRMVERNPGIVRVALTRGETTLIEVARPEREREQNNAGNSLLIWDGKRRVTRTPGGVQPGDHRPDLENFGLVVVEYTTPPPNAQSPRLQYELKNLVRTWRVRLVLVLGTLVTAYLVMMFGALLPVRRVVGTIDVHAHDGAPPLLGKAHSLLEEMHNNLARDATLARLSARLREASARPGVVEVADLARDIPDIVARHCAVEGVQAIIATIPDTADTPCTIHAMHGQDGFAWYPAEDFRDYLQARLRSHLEEGGASFVVAFSEHGSTTRRVVLLPVIVGQGRAFLLAVHAKPHQRRDPSPWFRDYYERIAAEIAVAARAVAARQREILAEKSKANVSLSRNLGHDLTNIIATAKLELIAMRQLMSIPPEQIAASPAKKQMLAESIEALLNTTKFMQEIVNLYRSFAYLSRPKFEEVDLAEVCAEVCALFRLSISSSLNVTSEAEPGLPRIEVEPRLLRLALYNLLTNATDAIKRGTDTQRGAGTINVRVRAAAEGELEIAVTDDGPGIRSPDGRLLEPEEIGQVFRLGYTTKGEGEGDGLGLNWVQSIVVEFHGGRVSARNIDPRGAEFAITLPTARRGGDG